MAAAANREPQRMCPGKSHGALHVRDAGAPRDERRTAIDVAIPDMSSAFVRGVIIHDQVAAQGVSKGRDLLVVESDACAGSCRQSLHRVTPGWKGCWLVVIARNEATKQASREDIASAAPSQ